MDEKTIRWLPGVVEFGESLLKLTKDMLEVAALIEGVDLNDRAEFQRRVQKKVRNTKLGRTEEFVLDEIKRILKVEWWCDGHSFNVNIDFSSWEVKKNEQSI